MILWECENCVLGHLGGVFVGIWVFIGDLSVFCKTGVLGHLEGLFGRVDEGGDVVGSDGILGMDAEVWDGEVIVDAVVEERVKEFDYGCCITVDILSEVMVEGDECWVSFVCDINAFLDGSCDDWLSVFSDD